MKTFIKVIPDDLEVGGIELTAGAYYLDTTSKLWMCTTGDGIPFIVVNIKTGERRNPDTLSFTKQVTNVKISYN